MQYIRQGWGLWDRWGQSLIRQEGGECKECTWRKGRLETVKQEQRTSSPSTTSSPRRSIETLLLEHHIQVDNHEFSGYDSGKCSSVTRIKEGRVLWYLIRHYSGCVCEGVFGWDWLWGPQSKVDCPLQGLGLLQSAESPNRSKKLWENPLSPSDCLAGTSVSSCLWTRTILLAFLGFQLAAEFGAPQFPQELILSIYFILCLCRT